MKKKLVLVLVLVLLVSIFLSGCFLTDKLSALKQSFSNDEKKVEQQTPTVVIESPEDTAVISEGKTLALYFADDSGTKLVLEERTIPKVVGIARASMEELIKGPRNTGMKPTLPASTRLLDINVKQDGLAIVDFSGDLVKDLPASAEAENLAIYSIVNTLTQFPTIQKVELRVDGKKVDTLLGFVKLSENLTRNTSLIQ